MKTSIPKQNEIDRKWWVVDADGQNLGRMATRIAMILRGKHKPQYVPYLDTGDFVVVVNADKVAATGSKEEKKVYYRHSGYPGGIYQRTLGELRQEKPEKILMLAVRGMLPKNTMGRKLLTKLKIYKGSTHPHEAQNPETLTIEEE